MSLQQLPVNNDPNQLISTTLSVDGASLLLNLKLHYNEVANYWVMSISDQNNNLLLDSLPLVTGNDPACNLLGEFDYLEIGSIYIINLGTTSLNYPDNNSLGNAFLLLWGDTGGDQA